jgi:hypothetical protein
MSAPGNKTRTGHTVAKGEPKKKGERVTGKSVLKSRNKDGKKISSLKKK